MCADFASLDGMGGNIPSASPSTDRLSLTVPGDVITGTTVGMQYLGSPNIFVDSVNSRIGVQQSSTPQILMGKHPKFGQGFFVSKSGINVVSNTDPNQFIFNSSQDVFKIVGTGTLTGLTASGTGSAGVYTLFGGSGISQVAHGLSFIPSIVAYLNINNGSTYFPLPYTALNNVGAGPSWTSYYAYADNTNVYIDTRILVFGAVSVAAAPISVKYYLLQETAN